ncbi:hypothetical protein HAX54_012447 [Datura stramonium]|uniref:DUF7705 domain-containing protein n=1 Tax=Datura stramonium TaxID=4076 RepID=A0ABS8TJV0_DATST|nr:hypothetical protein [Datura stramonium]
MAQYEISFSWFNLLSLLLINVSVCGVSSLSLDGSEYISAVGDSGMRRDGLRVAIEAWNQCNEVGEEAPKMGSPRAADCFDVQQQNPHKLAHKVTEEDNKLGIGKSFPGLEKQALYNVDLYAAEKELYLGSKCQVDDKPNPWQFWMIMLKSGNMDTYAAKCPKNGQKVGPFGPPSQFPCFGKGCMNQPLIYHNYTTLQGTTLKGSFYGTWDLEGGLSQVNTSFYSVTWQKELGKGSWIFHHVLRTSTKYPWLMLYLRSDATSGFSGGYHYQTRGMSKIIPESPNFKVRFTLNVMKGGGQNSQFYLMDMGSCWKNNGKACDGDVTSDVTRYSEMILNPETPSWCKPDSPKLCPPYHTFPNGTRVHRNDKSRFPYDAYHMYCVPGNGKNVEKPSVPCDPYSNPQPQEILQILPHPVWGEYGYPTRKGQGWIGDPRTWELDVGRLSHSLYFYQDPGTAPARRRWYSIDLGTEIYRDPNQVAEWTVTDFDILRFRKVCSYKCEYANPWFRAGKKHWLKNIKSRIQLSKENKPQQDSHSPSVDLVNDNLEEELEKLRNDHISLRVELEKLKDGQENMRSFFPTLQGCRKEKEIRNILKLLLEKSEVRGDSSSNDTRKRPQLVESPDHVAGSVQDGIGQTSNSAGGSVSSNEKQKEEATAQNAKNREFWEKLFEDDSESKNEGVESEQELNHSRAMAEIEEMVESKIAMEGEALIAKAAASLDDEMEAYLQLWT